MTRFALGLFIAAVALAAARGAADFGGMPAARALQAWWAARQFESAALHEDLDGLERIGRELRRLGAGDSPLRFAAHRIGFQVTGPSWGLPPGEVRIRAEQGLLLLEGLLEQSSDPWEGRLTQVLILVNRLPAAEFESLRMQAAEEWLASGGGPSYPFPTAGEAYREALRLPLPARSDFLNARFRTDLLTESGGD